MYTPTDSRKILFLKAEGLQIKLIILYSVTHEYNMSLTEKPLIYILY
jgi:hypothetical protein